MLLQQTELTPVFKTLPFGPETRFPALRLATRSSPLVVMSATSDECASSDGGAGFGARDRKVAPFVGIDKAGCALPVVKLVVS